MCSDDFIIGCFMCPEGFIFDRGLSLVGCFTCLEGFIIMVEVTPLSSLETPHSREDLPCNRRDVAAL